MADTLWVGIQARKLYLTSGEFTSTIKDSEDIGGIDTAPQGISYDIANTPWSGTTADKLYLQSGKITSTLKTSESVGAVDTQPTDITYDANGDTPWVGKTDQKLYLQSGQFTSTIKTSNGHPDTSATGISIDDVPDTYTVGTNDDKLTRLSGEFTSTIKSQYQVSGVEATPHGISWNGTDSPYCGTAGVKLYLQSGHFTSTLKTSVDVSGVDTDPYGIETDDTGSRLGLFLAPSAPAATDGHKIVTITFNAVGGATSYNLYWDTSSPVTKGGSNKIEGITSGYAWNVPAGYDTGVLYYFAVTAYNVGDGETDLSSEVNGTPYWLNFSSQQDLGDIIHTLTQSPTTDYYFAGCDAGKIFRSTDGGSTWVEITSTDGNQIHSMCCTVNGYIYAANNGGRVYYSSDNGASFAQAAANSWRNAPVGGDSARCVDSSGNRIYVVGDMQPGWDPVVTYSDDYGATWSVMATLGLGVGNIIDWLEVISQSELYVATDTGSKIFKYDGSFTDISDIAGARSLTVASDDNIYTCEDGGDTVRVKSTTGGAWSTLTGSALSITIDVHELVYSYGVIYVATDSTHGRLYMTDTDGTTYENTYIFSGISAVRAICLDCANGIIIVGGDNEIFKAPLPSPKGNTTLAAVAGVREVELTWSPMIGAMSYTLYWSLSSPVSKLDNPIVDVSSTYTHTIPSPGPWGVPYYYVVTSIGCGGESVISNEVSATPECGIPDAPENVTAIAIAITIINIDWDACLGATSYNIYWSVTPGVTTSDNVITGVLGTTYDHGGRTSGIIYYYRVSGVGSSGEGALSEEVNAVCPFDTTQYVQMLAHLLPKGGFWGK